MKKLLAKLSWLLVWVCTLGLTICLASCSTPKKADGDLVVQADNVYIITVTEAEEGATLQDVMEKMRADGALTYTDVGGMLTAINGYTPDAVAHEFFALYTSLDGYTSAAFGRMEVEGVEYESSIVGYERLPAVVGEIYIWAVSTW